MSNKQWALAATFVVFGVFLANSFTRTPPPQNTPTTVQGLSLENNITPRVIASENTVVLDSLKVNFERSVTLFGEVDENTVNQAVEGLLRLDNAKPGDPIYLLIASPGGSVFAGEELLSAMESLKSPVYTVCTSLCASMAAIIHQYGTQRLAFDRSILMFHDASGGVNGEVRKMQSMLTMIERKIERVDRYIANKSHMTYEKFMDMHKYDLWIDASDAKAVGLVDKLIKTQLDQPGIHIPSAQQLLTNFKYSEFNN